jgi:arylsulfatase
MRMQGLTIRLRLEDDGSELRADGRNQWHLGMRKEHGPWARGFKKSFTMLPGCSNHYGWEPVLENRHSGMMVGGRPIHAEDGVHVRM